MQIDENSCFDKWERLFREQSMASFNEDPYGILRLKVRSICRFTQLNAFLELNNISLESKTLSGKNRELYALHSKDKKVQEQLDKFLKNESNERYTALGVNNEQLREDLYKIREYVWGGDYKNSLDKFLISRYVKSISSYEELLLKQNEIGVHAWNYVQASWYNNWTSFLLESIFKKHNNVIPAVGEIKRVDFFINDLPIDLKVTYFPQAYLNQKLKSVLGTSEYSFIKKAAAQNGVIPPKTCVSKDDELYILAEKLKDRGCTKELEQVRKVKTEIIKAASQAPQDLIKWLYEHQDEMRFGAENRLFLILSDLSDLNESWKLKRAFDVIEPQINKYIDNFTSRRLHLIVFKYKGSSYTSLADAVFIVR